MAWTRAGAAVELTGSAGGGVVAQAASRHSRVIAKIHFIRLVFEFWNSLRRPNVTGAGRLGRDQIGSSVEGSPSLTPLNSVASLCATS